VGCDHDFVGELVVFCGLYDVFCGMKNQSLFLPLFLLRDFISQAHFPAIPSSTGVGQIKHLIEIDIEIGFADDAQLAVVVFFPDVFAVFTDLLTKLQLLWYQLTLGVDHWLLKLDYIALLMQQSKYHFPVLAYHEVLAAF
jgi:hypothetical protein